MTSTKLAGRCLCGAVRFTCSSPVAMRRQCWCRDCQYLSCGNASISVIVASDGLQVEGETRTFRSRADSGNHMVRSFCPTCGTQLFSAADETPGYLVIRAGALDDRSVAAPDSVIWTASAPTWAVIDPHLEASPGQPVFAASD